MVASSDIYSLIFSIQQKMAHLTKEQKLALLATLTTVVKENP
jgi:hypothetical protein